MKTLSFESPVVFRYVTLRVVRRTVSVFAASLLIASSVVAQQAPGLPSESSPAAEPNLAKELRGRQLTSYRDAAVTVEKLQMALDDAAQERDKIRARLLGLREALIEHQLLPESVSEVMSALAMELIDGEVELHGKRGRIKAIERAIAAQAARSQEELGRDEVLAKLMQIVELRKVAVARMQNAQTNRGVAGAVVQRAHADLAEAEIRLAVRKGELADGAASLATLNEQLLETTVDVAELEARVKYILMRLDEVRPLIELGREHDQIAELDLQIIERRIRSLQDRIEMAREKMEQARRADAKAEQAVEKRTSSGLPSED